MTNFINTDETELLKLIRSKDRCGAEALYDGYSKVLALAIFRIARNKTQTDDLLEKTFVRIWRDIDLYNEHVERFLPWMLTVARTLASEIAEPQGVRVKKMVFRKIWASRLFKKFRHPDFQDMSYFQ
jgi:DNA-directed RNA polymerase specialized sigma24 family protein